MSTSLGWSTEGSTVPNKQNPIEGVSGSSLVELKASVFEREEQLKRGVEPSVKKPRIGTDGLPTKQNRGIELRIKRDVHMLEEHNPAEVARRLSEKSLKYDRFVKDGTLFDSQGDRCLVDFERKGWEDEEEARLRRSEPPDWFEDEDLDTRGMMSEDMRREVMRRDFERQEELDRLEEEKELMRKQQRQEMFQEMADEQQSAKKTHNEEKVKRQLMLEERRRKIEELRKRKRGGEAEE